MTGEAVDLGITIAVERADAPEVEALRRRVRAFMDHHVVPQIAAWHDGRYVPGNMVVAAAGNLDHEAIVSSIEALLSTDYHQMVDLGRRLSGGDPYFVL
jgi:hypothetical protein